MKIKEFAKTSSGGTPKSTIPEYYEGGTIPWINSGELSSPFISNAENFITEEGYNNSSTKLFPPSTILLAMYGATAGKVSMLEIEACTNQAICAIMPDESKVNPLFLKYKLDTLYDYLVGLSTGSARDNLSQQGISNLDIELPDLPTQDSIASILSSLDRKIALNRKANEVLESMAKQLYDYWFVQFDFPNDEGKPYKSSGGKMVYNETLKREIPEGWEVKQLAELTKDEMESICPCDTPDVVFKHYSIPAFDDCASYALEKGDTILSNKFVPTDNDILVSKLNPWTSRVIWCTEEEDAICSTEFVSLAPENRDEKGFFFMLAKSIPFITYCTKASTGTSHSHRRVNPEIMKMFVLPYNKDIISAFSKIVSNYIEKSVKHTQENRKLQSLRDYLLPLLMNGQVKVS